MQKQFGVRFITRGVLVALFVLSFLYLFLAIYQMSVLKSTIAQKEKKFEKYKSEGISTINREKLELQRQLKMIKVSDGEIVSILSSKPIAKMPKDAGDPLKFKEELYKVQTKLKEDGSAVDFQFPFWLGFEKYEQDIPTAADLPYRVKQLDIIKEIGNLMLQCNITEVTAIEFLDFKGLTLEGGKAAIFTEFPVKAAFKCQNSNLVKFLHKLSVSDIPFKVDSMKLKASEGEEDAKGDLAIELVIVAVIFP